MKRGSWLMIPFLLLVAGTASAQRVRLDDSLSPVDSLHVDLAWEADALLMSGRLSAARAGAPPPPATGRLPGVDVRLDTREFAGQQARIFLSIAGLAESADFELRWETGGRFLPGTVRPGQSALVFEGLIEQPITSAVFSFFLSVGDDDISQNGLEVIYEIEVLP